jgi:hypothetical protein
VRSLASNDAEYVKAAAGTAIPVHLAPYPTPPAPSQHPLPMPVQSPTEYCKNRDNYDNFPLFFLENYLMFLDHLKMEDVNGKVSGFVVIFGLEV